MLNLKQNFNIFVISLPESKDRQKSAIKQLEKFSLQYKIRLFDRTTTIEIGEYNQKKRLQSYGYDMQPGEIGVFLSHRALWKEVIKSNQPAVILEDDFLITNHSICHLLSEINNLNDRYGLIRLQTCFQNKVRPLLTIINTNLVTYSKSKQGGATAYFIRPYVAEKLLHKTQAFYMPVDDFMDTECLHKNFIYGLYPMPITITNVESEIGVTRKPKMALNIKIKRELYRLPIALKSVVFKFYKKYKIIQASNESEQ